MGQQNDRIEGTGDWGRYRNGSDPGSRICDGAGSRGFGEDVADSACKIPNR